MRKFTYIFFMAIATIAVSAQAQTVVTIKDADLGTGTYNWTKNNVYLLDGLVFLESGGRLNIEAGTIIKGKETPTSGDNASALIITRGAQIYAEGTAAEPIVFTSELDDVTDPNDLDHADAGLWGGVIVLGSAPIGNASPEANIEGIPTTETRAKFGGTNSADNSGIIRYISILHGGAELGPGNEINGLTLGGVGSGTTIEYVEIFANSDDGIEWFGGTVDVKYLVSAFNEDDAVDWDLGWRGNGQFWFVIQRSDAGDNAGELDGAIPDDHAIFSNPVVHNATFIGGGTSGTGSNPNALLFRDGTAGTFANSIFTDFRDKAIEVEDLPASAGVDSRKRMEDGDLKLLNNIWYNFGAGSELNAGSNGIIRATPNAEDPNAQFLITHLQNNNNVIANPQIKGISRTRSGAIDPRPSNVTLATSNLAAKPGNNFFTQVNYKGAFDPGMKTWMEGWTFLSRGGYLKETVGVKEMPGAEHLKMNVYPNPIEGAATLSYVLPRQENVTINIVDVTGKTVQNVYSGSQGKGGQFVNFSTANLEAGVYFLQLTSESTRAVQKIMVR